MSMNVQLEFLRLIPVPTGIHPNSNSSVRVQSAVPIPTGVIWVLMRKQQSVALEVCKLILVD